MHPSPSFFALACAALLACQAPASTPTPAPEAPAKIEEAPAKGPKDAGDWSFEFKDPPPGPRAPTYTAFGANVGFSKFDDIAKLVETLGLDCGDTSIRAMMDRRRTAELKRIDEAKARGEDAVTAASWVNRRSKREANPQVRFSCPKIPSEKVTDRTRMPSVGRLLYVFDSVDYPLRHASFQRTHQDQAAALADFKETLAALTKIYGEPTKKLSNELPLPDQTGAVDFPSAVNFEVSWEYADLVVRTNVLRYGKLVTVGERVEVPHGIRPDAPGVGPGAIAPPPTPTLVKAPTPPTPAKADAATPGTTPGTTPDPTQAPKLDPKQAAKQDAEYRAKAARNEAADKQPASDKQPAPATPAPDPAKAPPPAPAKAG